MAIFTSTKNKHMNKLNASPSKEYFILITCRKFYSFHVLSFQFVGDQIAMVLATDRTVKLIPAVDLLSVDMAFGIVNGEYNIIKSK